jgi:hypothetical protein
MGIGFFVEDLSKQKLFKIETFLIKGTKATAVNLVELYQFCQGRRFKS